MVLEMEKGVQVAELDTGEEREELGKELGDEEVDLPAGGFKKIGGMPRRRPRACSVKELQAG
jgi:hypothetical protein